MEIVLFVVFAFILYPMISVYLRMQTKRKLDQIYNYIYEEIPINTWFVVQELVNQGFKKSHCETVLLSCAMDQEVLVRDTDTKECLTVPSRDAEDTDEILAFVNGLPHYEYKVVGISSKRKKRWNIDWEGFFKPKPMPGMANEYGRFWRPFLMNA